MRRLFISRECLNRNWYFTPVTNHRPVGAQGVMVTKLYRWYNILSFDIHLGSLLLTQGGSLSWRGCVAIVAVHHLCLITAVDGASV